MEELQVKFGLQRLDLMANGALRDTQFFSSSRKTLIACRGFEGSKRVQWRQTTKHVPEPPIRKPKAGWRNHPLPAIGFLNMVS